MWPRRGDSGALAAVALFSSFVETVAAELGRELAGREVFENPLRAINVADPNPVRYEIAGVFLVHLVTIVISQRPGESMGAGTPAELAAAAVHSHAVTPATKPRELALDALDRWIYDLGDEDADLRRQRRDDRDSLEQG